MRVLLPSTNNICILLSLQMELGLLETLLEDVETISSGGYFQ